MDLGVFSTKEDHMTITFGSNVDIILDKVAVRLGISVSDLLYDRSAKEVVRQECFAVTSRMIDVKSIPADVMQAIEASA